MNEKSKEPKNEKKPMLVCVVLLALAAIVCVWLLLGRDQDSGSKQPAGTGAVQTTDAQALEHAAQPDDGSASAVDTPTAFDLGNGLEITGLGDYTGMYMEDGSNEIVSGVMMIMVTNNGRFPLQYAEITLSGEAGDALFSLSTLNPGQTVVVLEANRRTYSSGDSYTAASSSKVVFFTEELDAHEDVLKIQPLDGGFNITNISDRDIAGDIVVYYKNYAGDLLYGGITYRGTISGGLEAGQIKQVMSSTFTESGTAVMFVTIAES